MEDWTPSHGRVQSALLEPRNYVALQKPHRHREAWEEWLQKLLDTGPAEVYWSVNSSKKWNVVDNGELSVSPVSFLIRTADDHILASAHSSETW